MGSYAKQVPGSLLTLPGDGIGQHISTQTGALRRLWRDGKEHPAFARAATRNDVVAIRERGKKQ